MMNLHVLHVSKNIWYSTTLTSEFRVATLMQKVHSLCGIPNHLQLLVFNGKLMHESERLSHYRVEDSDSIDLYVRFPDYKLLTVTVQHDNGLVEVVDAETQWSIAHLKVVIDKRIGVPPHRQRLMYMEAPMNEDDCIVDYVISTRPTVFLTEHQRDRPFKIRVYDDTGNIEWMVVDRRDTLNTVAAEMRRRGLNQGRDFYFMHYYETLYMRATLEDYGILCQTRLAMYFYDDDDDDDDHNEEEDPWLH